MIEKKDGSPRILMLEWDDDTRPLLKQNLCNQGYRVIVALEEEDAITPGAWWAQMP
jgi:DNA-binding response OmpR family regulator